MFFLAESTLHDLDPVAISLSSDLQIRWYGLAYLSGFLLAWLLLKWMSRTKRSLVPERCVGDMLVYCVIGVVVGGRFGSALFYDPSMFWTFSPSFPWWEPLAIWRGGMSSHGGMIGVAIATVLFSRRQRVPLLHGFDLVAIAAPPGLFLGRIANFVNGELWGKPLPESMQADPPWWSIKYPQEVTQGTVDLSDLVPHPPSPEFYQSTLEALHRGDPVVVEAVVPRLTAMYPSQLIQALAEGPVLAAMLIALWWVPRRPGVIAGGFLVFYGALRIATEVFRQADVGVDLILGLQRGQLLSVGMMLAGGVLWILSARSGGRYVGGFRPAPAGSAKTTQEPSDS
ncbi:MAG: prolipoprotein diacylglyceryl transferase [Phycisphaerales bacterium]|nr:prolipoprotein diacylglyceryl transferase [Phycisphaerales bacterium]